MGARQSKQTKAKRAREIYIYYTIMADKVLPKAMKDVSWAKPHHSDSFLATNTSAHLDSHFHLATTHIHPTLCWCHAAYE